MVLWGHKPPSVPLLAVLSHHFGWEEGSDGKVSFAETQEQVNKRLFLSAPPPPSQSTHIHGTKVYLCFKARFCCAVVLEAFPEHRALSTVTHHPCRGTCLTPRVHPPPPQGLQQQSEGSKYRSRILYPWQPLAHLGTWQSFPKYHLSGEFSSSREHSNVDLGPTQASPPPGTQIL